VERYYFDHNATTPVAPEVREAVVPLLCEFFGNASSIHYFGQTAKQRLEEARRNVAGFLGAQPDEIVFTSGGTESDYLSVLGAARGGHVVTTTIEHPAVLETAKHYGNATFVPVGRSGVVDPEDIRRALRPDTKVISVMHANNESGAVQPIGEIAKIAHDHGALMHSDGVQAAGKVPINVRELDVDLYSISGHKLYAPKGVGALYMRKGAPVEKVLHGGRHERGRRPGTENVAGAVGLGCAAQLSLKKGEAERTRLRELRDRLEQGILARVRDSYVNGEGVERTPNTSNIRFDGIEGESMVIALDLRGFAVATGAACSSGAVEPSHVLTAMGLTRDEAKSSMRFSLGASNTPEQVDLLIEAVIAAVAQLRKLSPTYA
jgi:cysteine desulfurase